MLTKTYNNIEKREFTHKFLELFNILQKKNARLDSKQILMLSEFILLECYYDSNRFNKKHRELVLKNLKEYHNWDTTLANITTYIHHMMKKGFVVEDQDRVKFVNPTIVKYIQAALKSNEPFDFIFRFDIEK